MNIFGASRQYSRVDEVPKINCSEFAKWPKDAKGTITIKRRDGKREFQFKRTGDGLKFYTDVEKGMGYTIPIETIPTINQRPSPFFRCTVCHTRRRYLYLNKTYWLCRKCSYLRHESSHGTKLEYLMEAVRQKRREIFGNEIYKAKGMDDLSLSATYFDKPKWKRWAKWERDKQALHELEQKYEREFCRRAAIACGDSESWMRAFGVEQ